MREVVEVTTEGIRFVAPADSGQNIRYAGEHIKSGEVVVGSGTVMGACEVGMAAFLGVEQVQVVPPVSVAVLSTGSELIASGAVLQKGQIRDSNGISLASALRQMGCRVTMQTRVPDHADALDQALEEAFSQSQVVLTSGGISAGWHDLVRGRIEKMGGEFSFHKLRMRPGKPLAFGHCGDSHFFCLPGNPVSSMVTFEVFAKPALRKMAGLDPLPQTLRARLTERIVKREGFTIFYRGYMEARPDGNRVRLTGPQGSHMLRSLVEANVLVRTEECDRVLEADSIVTVLPLKGAGFGS
jgi:molybdopterin molybdotransferase